MEDITLGTDGAILPGKTNKIALIDADTIAFAAASSTEYVSELLPREMYTDSEWAEILVDPGYFEDSSGTQLVYGTNIDEATTRAMDKIEFILDHTGCRDFSLHFTAGRESFRYTNVTPEYKANRLVDSQGVATRAPFGLYQLKQELCRQYPLKTKMWTACEADDAVWMLGNRYRDKYLVCAVDKDILNAMEVPAFNYYARAAYVHPKSGNSIEEIKMRFVEAENPTLWWYIQCLTGDPGDGIIGVKGIGPKKAWDILRPYKTDKERWDAIVQTYERYNRDVIDALLNMRMVRLDQYDPETNVLKLWSPKDLK